MGTQKTSTTKAVIILLVIAVVPFAWIWVRDLKQKIDDKAQKQLINRYVYGLKPGDDVGGLTLHPVVLLPVEAKSFDHLYVHFEMGRLIVLALSKNKIVSSYVSVYSPPFSRNRWLTYNGMVLLEKHWETYVGAYNQFDLSDDNAASVAREMGKLYAARKDEIARILNLPKENKYTPHYKEINYHFRGMSNEYLDFIDKNFAETFYVVKYAKIKPEFKGSDWAAYWNSPAWQEANVVTIDKWSTYSTQTQPNAQVKVLYDETGIWLMWKVKDTYVVAKAKKYLDDVSSDSCVAFFFEPAKSLGYVDLETNAGGTLLWRVHKPVPTQDTSVYPPDYQNPALESPLEMGLKVQVRKSMPNQIIDTPIEKPMTWYVQIYIPFESLKYAFDLELYELVGATWRGNFYKILDSKEPVIAEHNHYGAWSPLPPGTTNLHQPANFAPIRFEDPNPPQKASPKKPAE